MDLLDNLLGIARGFRDTSFMQSIGPFTTKNNELTPELIQHINPFLTMTIDNGKNSPSYALVSKKTKFTMPLEVLKFVIDHCVVSRVGFSESVHGTNRNSKVFAIRPTHLAMTEGIRLVTKVSEEFKDTVQEIEMLKTLNPNRSRGVKRPLSWLLLDRDEAHERVMVQQGDDDACKLAIERLKFICQEAKKRRKLAAPNPVAASPNPVAAAPNPVAANPVAAAPNPVAANPVAAAPNPVAANPVPAPPNPVLPATLIEDSSILNEDVFVEMPLDGPSGDDQCLDGYEALLEDPFPGGFLKGEQLPVHSSKNRRESEESHESGIAEHEAVQNDITFSVKVMHGGVMMKTYVLLIECKTDATLKSPEALCQAVNSVLRRAFRELPVQQDVHVMVVGTHCWQYGVVRLYGKVKVACSKVVGVKFLESSSKAKTIDELQSQLDERRSALRGEFKLADYVDDEYILADAFISEKKRSLYDGKFMDGDALLFYQTLLLIVCGKKARTWTLQDIQEVHKDRVDWEVRKDDLRSIAPAAFEVLGYQGFDETIPNLSGYCKACFQGRGYGST